MIKTQRKHDCFVEIKKNKQRKAKAIIKKERPITLDRIFKRIPDHPISVRNKKGWRRMIARYPSSSYEFCCFILPAIKLARIVENKIAHGNSFETSITWAAPLLSRNCTEWQYSRVMYILLHYWVHRKKLYYFLFMEKKL